LLLLSITVKTASELDLPDSLHIYQISALLYIEDILSS